MVKVDLIQITPNATYTSMVVTANFREWRYIIGLRGTKHAQWEIRDLVRQVLKILKNKCLIVFNDLSVVDD